MLDFDLDEEEDWTVGDQQVQLWKCDKCGAWLQYKPTPVQLNVELSEMSKLDGKTRSQRWCADCLGATKISGVGKMERTIGDL